MKRLQSHGFEPTLGTYETLVWGFAQVADWEAAVRFLAYVLGLGVQPSARSWDAAIAACSQAGHWERALALLADMRRQGVRPSRVTYTAAVAGLNRPRYSDWGPKLEKLARLLHDRRGDGEDVREGGGGGLDGPSPEDFDCSIEALGDAGDAGGAACLLRVMRQEGFHASPRAYRSVIYACARVGHLNEAMALAKEMQSSSSVALSVESDLNAAKEGELFSSSPVVTVPGESGVEGEGDGEGQRVGVEVGVREGEGERGGAYWEGEREGRGGRDWVGVGVREREEKGKGVEEGLEEGKGGGGGEGGEQLARLQPPPLGAITEDDGSEFDITVVYNCIISNFARAATQSGSGSSSSSSGNGNGGYMDICEHRTGRTSRAMGEEKRGAVGARDRAAAVVGAGAAGGGGAAEAAAVPVANKSSGRDSRRGGGQGRGGDEDGDGLVALLLGVAERAEGSLLNEGANGGVEVAAVEDVPPSLHP
ncbi:unnamed protein product [Laminaria digitata]